MLQGINAIWLLLGILILVGMAVIVLLSRKKEETLVIESKRAEANANLVKTRDMRIEDLESQNQRLETELEDVTSEYRVLVGVDVKKLMDYWQIREDELAKIGELESQVRVLNRRLGAREDDASK